MQRDLDRLEDIAVSAADVLEFCSGLTRDGSSVNPETESHHCLRNRSIDDYGDLDLIWKVATMLTPALRVMIEQLLKNVPAEM